jgi:hypothetical protein
VSTVVSIGRGRSATAHDDAVKGRVVWRRVALCDVDVPVEELQLQHSAASWRVGLLPFTVTVSLVLDEASIASSEGSLVSLLIRSLYHRCA